VVREVFQLQQRRGVGWEFFEPVLVGDGGREVVEY